MVPKILLWPPLPSRLIQSPCVHWALTSKASATLAFHLLNILNSFLPQGLQSLWSYQPPHGPSLSKLLPVPFFVTQFKGKISSSVEFFQSPVAWYSLLLAGVSLDCSLQDWLNFLLGPLFPPDTAVYNMVNEHTGYWTKHPRFDSQIHYLLHGLWK